MITINDFRLGYRKKIWRYFSPGKTRVCIVGSCRMAAIANYLRAHMDLHSSGFELMCVLPVVMKLPGNATLDDDIRTIIGPSGIGCVDFLVCEHVVRYGVANTVCEMPLNVFDSLDCRPEKIIRIPNWNEMHIYDAERADKIDGYGLLEGNERVEVLRNETLACREKFLGRCAASSIPDVESWVRGNWRNERLGWTHNHFTRVLSWEIFKRMAALMDLHGIEEVASHPDGAGDVLHNFQRIVLNDIDYLANDWQF